MQLISRRLKFVNTSVTAKINDLVIKRKNLGEKVLSLSVGEPDFDTPENIKTAAHQAINKGLTKYTSTGGLEQLKSAIASKFLRENSIRYDLNEIIVCAGGKQVIFNALLATLNPEDEVVIPSPYWVSYPDMVSLCGAKPIVIETSIKSNFKITADDLKTVFNSKTKWFILNSPSNPTGSIYTNKELTKISEILEVFPNINIISDDIYEHIIYDNLKFSNIVQVNPALKSRTLLVNGVSKSHAMTGWRIGYGAAKQELINAMIKVQSQSTSSPTSISQYAAIGALEGPNEFILKNKIIYQNRRDLMIKILSQSKFIELVKPMGAFYALPSIIKTLGKSTPKGAVIRSDIDFTMELLDETGVAVVPGSAFGAQNSFRISFAVSETLLEQACDLIVKFVDSLK